MTIGTTVFWREAWHSSLKLKQGYVDSSSYPQPNYNFTMSISILKLWIVIGSSCAYSSHIRRSIKMGVQLNVSNYKEVSIEHLWLDTSVIYESIIRALMTFFFMFPTVLKTYGECYWCFRSKEVLKILSFFLSLKFVLIRKLKKTTTTRAPRTSSNKEV